MGSRVYPLFFYLGFSFVTVYKTWGWNYLTLVYVHQWMRPWGWNMGSAVYGVWVPCNDINTELFLSKESYFSVQVCINFLYSFLWLLFSIGCGMDVCFWEERKRAVWNFRNKTLLLDHFPHNLQNWDFCFHLTAVIMPEFILFIKFQTVFICLFSSFLIFLPMCMYACTHILFLVLICVCTHTRTLL